MPPQEGTIEQLSVGVNVDGEAGLKGMEAIIEQVSGMWDEIAEKAKGMTEVPFDAMNEALVKMSEALGDDLAVMNMLNEAQRRSEELGIAQQAMYLSVAEAVSELSEAQKKAVTALTPEQLAQLAEGFKRVLTGVQQVSDAYQEQGRAIPFEKLEQLEAHLNRILTLGVAKGAPMTDIMARMNEVIQETADGAQKGAKETEGMGNAMSLVNMAAGKLGINLGSLLTTVGLVGAAFGLAIKAGKEFIQFLQESTALAIEDSEAHLRLQLAVRVHQRATDDLTLTQQMASDAAAELAETYGMAGDKAENLLGRSIFLTREFGLSADETIRLAESATILARAVGQDAESALRSVTQFMLTGYGRGLQQLGIMVDQNTVKLKAYELGLISFGQEVDETIRAQVALAIVEEQSLTMRDDAIASIEGYAAAIEKARQAREDEMGKLGEMLAPFSVFTEKIKTFFTVAFARIISGAIEGLVSWGNKAVAVFEAVSDTIDAFGKGGTSQTDRWLGGGEGAVTFAERLAVRMGEADEATKKTLENMAAGGIALGDALPGVSEAWDKLAGKVYEAGEKMKKTMDKLRDHNEERLQDIEQNLRDTMEKITLDFDRKRADAQLELARDLAEIDEDAQRNRIEQTSKNQEKQYEIEKDFKLRLKRLEEQYLLDLEDAVRERDARQVLLLQRRFNLDKKNLEEDKNVQRRRTLAAYKQELADIEVQRELKRQERLKEFQQEMADTAVDEQRRRIDANLAADQARRDLKIANDRKLREIAEAFLSQFNLTQDSLTSIYTLLNKYMGPGGYYDQIYSYIAGVAANVNLAPGGTSGVLQDPSQTQVTQLVSPYTGRSPGGGFQRGGTMFATTPQMIRVGEIPERVDITPLSSGTGGPKAGFGGGGPGGEGRLAIDIDLGDGLVGEIVDKSMDSMANVLVDIGRKQRAR